MLDLILALHYLNLKETKHVRHKARGQGACSLPSALLGDIWPEILEYWEAY